MIKTRVTSTAAGDECKEEGEADDFDGRRLVFRWTTQEGQTRTASQTTVEEILKLIRIRAPGLWKSIVWIPGPSVGLRGVTWQEEREHEERKKVQSGDCMSAASFWAMVRQEQFARRDAQIASGQGLSETRRRRCETARTGKGATADDSRYCCGRGCGSLRSAELEARMGAAALLWKWLNESSTDVDGVGGRLSVVLDEGGDDDTGVKEVVQEMDVDAADEECACGEYTCYSQFLEECEFACDPVRRVHVLVEEGRH